MRSPLLLFLVACLTSATALGQDVVSVAAFAKTPIGLPEVRMLSSPDYYYVLEVATRPGEEHHPVDIAPGTGDTLTLTESILALPQERYRVRRWRLDDPGDADRDGRDDVSELSARPLTVAAPLNTGMPVDEDAGALRLPTEAAFRQISIADEPDAPGLAPRRTTKIYLTDNRTDSVSLYFVDVNVLPNHVDFARAVGIPTRPNGTSFREDMRGTLVYHPDALTPDGRPGVYTFHFGSFSDYATTPCPSSAMDRLHDRHLRNKGWEGSAHRPLRHHVNAPSPLQLSYQPSANP